MKRSAHTANSFLTETTNNHSPKRSCTVRNKLYVASNSTSACSSSSPSNDILTIEDHIQSLISMGFIDRNLNRKLLIKTNNDINEVVTLLTSYNYFDDNDDDDDDDIPNETTTTTFVGPLTKEQQQTVPSNDDSIALHPITSDELTTNDFNSFTTNAFLDLETKVYGDNWSIPYKRAEALGQCLLSGTKLALNGIADQDKHCVKFMEELIPEIFRKLQCSHHVNTWGIEVQQGVFDMVELLIDLIAARLSYIPTPVKLLEILSILFDHDSLFQRKHKTKSYDRSLYDKQLGDRALANPPSISAFSVYSRTETYGWLCQIINRFVYKDGINNLKIQFKNEKSLTALEYNALLSPFVNCMDYIFIDRYKQLFNEHIEQALDYIKNLKEEDFKAKSTYLIFELLATLRKICSIVWINRIEQIEQLHLNLLLKMISLSNFNSKMNSLKELAKLIENSTMNIQKTSIRRDVISDWIIENSILSKALEGNIDQNQYVDKVRILLDFIAPKILKEDIETIWKMQHGRSLVAVDHLFTLIASAAAKFNLQQLNFLIEFIHNSWKTETILIQEKLIELLGAIGRECQKDLATRVLEILWDMAHENHLSRSMLDHILYSHLRIFSEGRSTYETLKRDYCLKCMTDLQRKQGWLVPAIKHLYDLLRHDSTNTFKRTDQDLISLLVNKHDLISALIQSLSTCQLNVWNQTHGHVTIDTLVDGRFTHEESIENHLNLLSFLLKKGNLYLILKRSEELWDTLITNENVSSFDHELGFNWFITCVEDLNRDSQNALFEKRVSKLNPINLSSKGYECFKLYFERCNLERQNQSKNFNSTSNTSTSINNQMLEYKGIDELWNIILCVNDDNLANDVIRFLLDLYYLKQPNRTRTLTAQSLYEYFLNEIYTRLSILLCNNIISLNNENTEEFYKSLKLTGELLINTYQILNINEINYELWLQKIERLLMIIEEYINIVEHEHSSTSHIKSFYSLEYQIKIILGEFGKTNSSYDIITVHANDTLEMLRIHLAKFYKVSSFDIHISIQNTQPLPKSYDYQEDNNTTTTVLGQSLNSKYLYEVHIKPGTIIYIKILASTFNQIPKSINSEPIRMNLKDSSYHNINNNDDELTHKIPSNMLAENSKVYDVLYKLSHLNNKNIHQRIRNLLYLMPSDIRIHDNLDFISIRAINTYTNERRQSTENCNNNNNIYQINPQEAIDYVFNINNCSLIQLLYHLEILSSKIHPLSTNNGIKQSSKIFQQDFIKQFGLKYLFQLLQSLTNYINNQYQYILCQEMTLLILQLIQYLIYDGNYQQDENLSILNISNDNLNNSFDINSQEIIEHLEFNEFVNEIKQFIFLCWAAAAGNIKLQGQNVIIQEQIKLNHYDLLQQINMNIFSKNSLSNQSLVINNQIVQFGICVKTQTILPLDSEIAEKIIEIIIFYFEKRPEFIATFLIQAFFADFILEILIGTISREIRQCTLRNIKRLCKIDTSICDVRSIIHQILLKARLPLWTTSSSSIRRSNQKLLEQSLEYFDLRCQLTENLTEEQQNILNINAKQLLSDELIWLSSYTISNQLRTIDNILFLGHLKFIRTLLTCENIDKKQIGNEFIRLIIDQFLFPASKCISLSINNENDFDVSEPKCSTNESRLAAYELLVELVRNCEINLKILINDLINLHHKSILEKHTEWEFMPQVNPRSSCGFIGLYNGGATCYMNSILQQLFMLPQISEFILNIHDDEKQTKDSNLFYQIQQVFGHLKESKMQYYAPESLWKIFRLWGQEINIREQQDAFDFFTSLTDQIDEYLKTIKQDEIFHKQFEGIFSNQMICMNGCQHRYEGEEKFMALNVAIKVESLNESLNQFVKGELLDGNNQYFCSKCQQKRTTIKRLCIKKLPTLLCIQMKRFGFDWENNRALKFDDYFKFPFILNMEPYTVEGVNKRENFSLNEDLINEHKISSINYELIGIVIHSGQANAGHYYSFIKDIREDNYSNKKNQWYRFNDTTVDEIQLNEQMLEEECFGGTFRSQKKKNNNEERTRFWNAYMLIYRCIEPSKLLPPPSSTNSLTTHLKNHSNQHDSLSQLADLVVQSENKNLFQIKKSLIPSNVLACVKDENLEFLKYRDTYCDDYYQFIYKLSNICLNELNTNTISDEFCTKLLLNFLFHTFFRTHYRLRKDNLNIWMELLSRLFKKNSLSCEIFYLFLFEKKQDDLLKLYLLDCPIDDIRDIFEQICQEFLHACYIHNLEKNIEFFIEQLIDLLDKSVVEQIKHSQSYFQLIYTYLNMNEKSIEYLLKLNLFERLKNFLLGENIDNRRWNSGQAKDFSIIHEIISILILNNYSINQNSFEIKIFFSNEQWLNRYLKEICYACQEISSTQLIRTLQLIETLAKNNENFSQQIIRILLQSIVQVHMNDLKSLFKLLSHILLIDDCFQRKRLQLVFEGINESDNGLYLFIRTTIENEQRRAYQIVKFLITLSNKSNACKNYFSSTAIQWESAINWLKQQMQTTCQWSPAQNLSNEDTNARSFQRTRSAQFTLEQAQSLLQQTKPIKYSGNLPNNISNSESMEFNDNNNQSTLVGNEYNL